MDAFPPDVCLKLNNAWAQGEPTFLLSNKPTVFVNLRTFMLRNVATEMEIAVRKRGGDKVIPAANGQFDPRFAIKDRSNDAALYQDDGRPSGQPNLRTDIRASCETPTLDQSKPGRFAMAWASELEDVRNRTHALLARIAQLSPHLDRG
eukprot:CAMPEP_0113666890 /NCGR_PEP_ID=MMETSP0038_2-20120614/3135_1 /TAXON_ID=2898 /ORGANISM="Cryptomonas paramecium" /LENGTH=148 /DNA_ID=CAMNT_0000582451 /DNA_START=95 /DNA_END=538 /DNA_ORIENTATION=+ /assembly_acc=CAM_ASM_000170